VQRFLTVRIWFGNRGREVQILSPTILFDPVLRSKLLEVGALAESQVCSCNTLRCLYWPLRLLGVFKKATSKSSARTDHSFQDYRPTPGSRITLRCYRRRRACIGSFPAP